MAIAARTMQVTGADSLELKIPPLAVVLIAAGLMLLMRWLTPTLVVSLDLDVRMWAALPVLAAGIAIAVAGVIQFRRSHTTVNPMTPERTSALVSSGIYRYTRNPMYVGVLAVILGHFLWFGFWYLLIYAAVIFLAFHTFVTYYEEPTLRKKFGVAYEDYCKRVPRWFSIFK